MSAVKRAVAFFKDNNLTPYKEEGNGSEWLVVPFTSEDLYDEFIDSIGKYMNSPMEFICQTKELRILL